MATFSNSMVITNSSLSSISKELINKRTYKAGSISIIGSPIIENGIARNISDENYFRKADLVFGNYSSSKITFSGVTGELSQGEVCCAWRLYKSPSKLILYATRNSWILQRDNTNILTLSGINNVSKTVKTTLDINGSKCTLSVIIDNKLYQKTVNLSTPIKLSNYNLLFIGKDGGNVGRFWNGNIDLSDFAIYGNDITAYSTAVENSFNFTTLMVGDGTYPLNDKSSPVLNHTFAFPIKEISRTNNNLLLTATISEEAKLTIREIGLYSEDELGQHLFSLIPELNLEKGEDLAYNLLINVKLDINVVNTVAFPEIIIDKPDYPSYKDFDTVKKTFAYAIENLERMIRLNAIGVGNYQTGLMQAPKPVGPSLDNLSSLYDLFVVPEAEMLVGASPGYSYIPETLSSENTGINNDESGVVINTENFIKSNVFGIGYNKPQVYCAYQDNITSWEDNFCATLNYANLKHQYKGNVTTYEFDPEAVIPYGDSEVSDSGEGRVSITPKYDVINEAFIADSSSMSVDIATQAFISEGEFEVSNEAAIAVNNGRIEPAYFQYIDFNEWNAQVYFQTANNITTDQVILNFAAYADKQPLVLGIKNGYCYLSIIEQDRLQVAEGGSYRIYIRGTERKYINGKEFFNWVIEGTDIEILLDTLTPTVRSVIYNSAGIVQPSLSIRNVFSGTIYEGNLFPVVAGNKYKVFLSYEDGHYKVSYSSETQLKTQVVNIETVQQMNNVVSIAFGSKFQGGAGYTSGFDGILFLDFFNLNFYEYNSFGRIVDQTHYSFNEATTTFNLTMTDFYHLPDYDHSYFMSNNLEKLDGHSVIEVLEGYLKGQEDYIDFTDEHGYSLCVRVDLKNTDDKIILAKGDLKTENFYFILKLEDNNIIFEYYLGNDVVILSHEITKDEISDYTRYPITLTFTISADSSPELKLYKDNELLDSEQIGGNSTLNYLEYPLVNILSNDDEPYDQRIVRDIMGVKGVLTPSDLYYVNTIFNTNF